MEVAVTSGPLVSVTRQVQQVFLSHPRFPFLLFSSVEKN